MILLSFIVLLPVIWMVTSSFRPHSEIFRYTEFGWELFIPVDFTFENYVDIFSNQDRPFGVYILNTLFVAVVGTVSGLFINALAAFSFAKLRFPLKKTLMVLFLSTLVIPFEAIMIPQYLLIRDLGWLDSYKALIIPQIVWAFGIFMLIQFFSDIPRDMLEAARIDGASWLQIFFRIAVPISTPALITLGIMTFINRWDEFLWPLIVISDDSRQLIQVAIASYTTQYSTSWGLIFAASTVASIPTLIIFLFLQRYYVQGITTTGLKG
ncbi:sugar ABC transporter permease [Novibacillus thermophilus]|uniref:Sugar ABC transporter permease n=2 Tax=Novibacillus thermophilus TaxID=1471761 RepID=A0A1U9KBY5_9BACL|nr:sugar ABC transporter permease [Novibacillus thermophilus]